MASKYQNFVADFKYLLIFCGRKMFDDPHLFWSDGSGSAFNMRIRIQLSKITQNFTTFISSNLKDDKKTRVLHHFGFSFELKSCFIPLKVLKNRKNWEKKFWRQLKKKIFSVQGLKKLWIWIRIRIEENAGSGFALRLMRIRNNVSYEML